MTEVLRARYRLFPVSGEDGVERARHLAREQTVECPPGIAPEAEERALSSIAIIRSVTVFSPRQPNGPIRPCVLFGLQYQ